MWESRDIGLGMSTCIKPIRFFYPISIRFDIETERFHLFFVGCERNENKTYFVQKLLFYKRLQNETLIFYKKIKTN
jgi:hypothetical protein